MGRVRVLPYKMSSISSRSISKHFGILRIYPNGKFIPRNGDVIINWGHGGYVPVFDRNNANFTILNKPECVSNASNKITCLRKLKEANVPHVEFALSKENASSFIKDGFMVYCRNLIMGKEGKGIVIAKTEDELSDNCRLYTKHFKNDREFRIHVFDGEVIDVVEKQRMTEKRMIELKIKHEDLSDDIKNRKKGWSFNRKDVVIPKKALQIAIDATKALGLDFAAVDLAHNNETDETVVLELNTAPGQTRGTDTNYRYVKAISKYLGKKITLVEYRQRYNCKLKYGNYNE